MHIFKLIVLHHITLWALLFIIPSGWKKRGNNTLILGNDDQVPMNGEIEVQFKIQQYHSQFNCIISKLSDAINMILGNDWLVQYKVQLSFQYECCMFYKGHCKINVCVNQGQNHSPNPFRLTIMQLKQSIWKEQPCS
jgi:hypothetical protein